MAHDFRMAVHVEAKDRVVFILKDVKKKICWGTDLFLNSSLTWVLPIQTDTAVKYVAKIF